MFTIAFCAYILYMKTVRNVSLKKYTTFKIGGRAKVIYFPENEEELLKLAARFNKKKVLILGNGSNILFSDHGFDGKIISTRRLDKIEVSGERVFCEAGVNLFSLCHFCAEHGLSRLERLYGIPGSVGGAIVGEWISSSAGLGYYMLRVKNGYMLDKVFATVVVVVVVSLLLNGAVSLAKRWLCPHHTVSK